MRIVRTTPDDDAFKQLVSALDRELQTTYGAGQDPYTPLNLLPIDTACVVAFSGPTPVGTGAFRKLATREGMRELERAEIKRMFVAPTERGRGIARAVLTELEVWARERAVRELVLETGPEQKVAMALYESAGFVRMPSFGAYSDLPLSICYAKSLA